MSSKAAQRFVDAVGHRGPHEVLRGDLTPTGLTGDVYTPVSGEGLPAIAFGHGWLQPTYRYAELFGHLASWGFVVAAPGSATGLASHQAFADDLRTALDVCSGVRLGTGDVTVDPDKLGLVGHGLGGGAAVLAAAAEERCKAVVTLALAETRPSAVAEAPRCAMPALHLAGHEDLIAPPIGHAEPVADAWGGPVQLRILDKADHLSFVDGWHWSQLVLDGKPSYGVARLARAFTTAFLLKHLADEDKFEDLLADDDVKHTTLELDRS